MDANARQLRKKLKDAGLTERVIDAAWPAWWSNEAANSLSAQAELRFSLARRLGLSPTALVGDRVEFVWKDNVRFKNLRVEDDSQRAAINSFGVAIARLLFRGTPRVSSFEGISASSLRDDILRSSQTVSFPSLLARCWRLGIPVVHLRVRPLKNKSMHAMIVREEGRYAVLLVKDAKYPAPAAFWLAHELGHAANGHLKDGEAIADVFEPEEKGESDIEEKEADEFALTLLTGSKNPNVTANVSSFSARSLAGASLREGGRRGIDPGTLALCLAYNTGQWAVANAAMRHIYAREGDVWQFVNSCAERELLWQEFTTESADYLRQILALNNG